MKLFYIPGTCSLAPHIVAREAEIDIELVRVDIATKRTTDGVDYLTINAKGSVPALQLDNGQVLTEGPAIMQYLADLVPEAKLAPRADDFQRYRLQEWLNWLSSELHKGFGSLWLKDSPQKSKELAKAALGVRFALLDGHLSRSKHLLNDYSVADAYAVTILGWASFFAIDLARWPHLAAYVARVRARPAVRAAFVAEGLVDTAV